LPSNEPTLREYVSLKVAALDRHITAEIAGLRRETTLANENAEKAIEVAAHEAADRLAAHNGLIEQMRAQASLFATRESVDDFKESIDRRLGKIERFQAMLTGGLILVSSIGVANLVKVWTG
jgi:ribosome-associated translation inhibitor RaiA